MFTIEMLEANEGDSLWIEYGHGDDIHRILIDTGRKDTYRELVERIAGLERPLDLFVMTHIDDDHIFGAIPLFADARIGPECFEDVWYNGFTHLDPSNARRPPADALGAQNGEFFSALLLQGHYTWNRMFDDGATVVVEEQGALPSKLLSGGMRLTLLSPGWTQLKKLQKFWTKQLTKMEPGDAKAAWKLFEETARVQPDVLGGLLNIEAILEDDKEQMDSKAPNGSSIAFLAEWDGRRVLFTGDAHPPVLAASIRRLLRERGEEPPLRLDAFKVSHHGSKKNTSRALLELVDCPTFLISTDGTKHEHPDRQALARIVAHNRNADRPTQLLFNFHTEFNRMWDDPQAEDEWNYRAVFPPAGRLLDLEAG